jgi:hypothetical protein
MAAKMRKMRKGNRKKNLFLRFLRLFAAKIDSNFKILGCKVL